MDTLEQITTQLDELITAGDGISRDELINNTELPEAELLKNRLEAAIDRIAPIGSTYIKQLDLHRSGWVSTVFPRILAIAKALRDDLKKGWTRSVTELVHAETNDDYLEMAYELLGANYKDPSAVIAGTTLEVHVRALCVKYGIDTELADGSYKKTDVMNADLKRVGVYGKMEQKQITAWMDIRNAAAHGNYDNYDENNVRLFIDGVRNFIAKFPA
jgi:hypothetical protein